MFKNILSVLVLVTGFVSTSVAQKIVYSEPDRDDQKSLNFDIIGKINNHYLVYKNYRSDHNIVIFDNDMKPVDKKQLDFLPDKVLSTDVLSYKDFFYFFYQYQKRNIVYCFAAKIDGNGTLMGEPRQLDTTAISFFASNKLYTIINSDDKQKIMVLKVNNKNSDNNILTTSLFDTELTLLHKTRASISMPERSDFLTEFTLDNDGGLAFARPAGTAQNDNINGLAFITKGALTDDLSINSIDVSQIYLDDIRIKADNTNKRYLITSFYSKTKRGNIEGLYCILWDKATGAALSTATTTFSDEMRNDAKSEGSVKTAFNDFFLQKILIRKDGGFAVAAESVYTSTRGIYNNRWDYLYGSPYSSLSDYYYWNSPYSSYYSPWGRWGNNNQVNRYFADNVVMMSFDSTATMQWSNVIHKSQYDDYTDNFIGYGTLNTGGEIHYLFNQLERRTQLLTDQSINADGQANRSPTLHNLSKDYQFMPKYGKQVGSREIIIPCQYRNFVCFAKIEF
ncbi:MAG: hypothetical protein ABI921_06315 [Panacibacter sp.]